MAPRPARRKCSCWIITGLLALCFPVSSPAQSQQKGDASLRIEYQYIGTGAYEAETFSADYWTTDSQVLMLSGDYAFNERWTVYAALPYVRKRFVPAPNDPYGGDPHNPNDPYWIDFVPPDTRFWDDGEYHGDLQDLSFGLLYKAVDGPAWTVSPYIGYAVPASDYPFFAKAAIGQNLWNFPVGVDVSFIPYFSDWHFRGNLAYVFSEKPLGYNVDYWLGFLSAGYWFRPDLSIDLFATAKYLVDGLIIDYDFSENPADYPNSYDNILWWQHDRLIRHRILNLGISIDYYLNEKYQLSGSYYQTVWADQTNEVDDAYSISLTRYWGGE